MAGVTESDVLRFFFASRAARKARPDSPEQERLNRAVRKRALEQQLERDAEGWDYERSLE